MAQMTSEKSCAGGTETNEASKTEEAQQMTPDLPPRDGGSSAWLFLGVCTLLEALLLGFPLSYGTFQQYYTSHEPFRGSTSLQIVGLLQSGIANFLAPFLISFNANVKRIPLRKPSMVLGLLFCLASSIGAAFAKTEGELIFTQGALWGVGIPLLSAPQHAMLFEWFNERLGFALGVMYAGNAVAGTFLPLAMAAILQRYGRKTTLLGWAVIVFIIVAPSIIVLRTRGQDDKEDTRKTIPTWHIMKSKRFWIFSFSNTIQGIGNFLPSLLLPAYATGRGISPLLGTLSLSLLNLFTAVSQVLLGYVSDHVDVHIPMFLSAVSSSLAVFFLWGFASNLAAVLAFGALYGLLSGGYGILWGRFTSAVMRDMGETGTGNRKVFTVVFGTFVAERGVGYLICSPLSVALLNARLSGVAYVDDRYTVTILIVGATLAVSSLGVIGRFIKD